MAEIQVNERWRISSYTHGWSLQKAKQGKNKATGAPETAWVGERLYATFDDAVTGLARVMLRESGATEITRLKADAMEIAEFLGELRKVDTPTA